MFGTFDEPLNADDLHPLSAVLFDVTKGPFGSDMKKSLYVPRSERTYKAYIQLNAIEKNAALGEYFISEAYFEEKMFKYEVKPGDYIVTCDGTLGKIFRLPAEIERGVISSSLMRIRLNEESISPQYFESLWDFDILPRLKAQVRNGCLVHLPSAKVLLNTHCILPPISRQKEFGDLVAAVDKLKFGQLASKGQVISYA